MEKISLKNYRSISDSGEIDIKPLTIAVGRNSAGKSSFVRLFPLLKQTLERKISDSLLWYGDYVDFGDFQHTVSKQNPDKPIEISFSIMTYSRYYPWLYNGKNKDAILVKVELSVKEKYIEKIRITLFDQIVEIVIAEDGYAQISVNNDMRQFVNMSIKAYRQTGDIIPSLYEEVKNGEHVYLRTLDISDIRTYCINYVYSNRKETEYNKNYPDFDLGSKESILRDLKKMNLAKFENKKINQKRIIKINNYIIALNIVNLIERINTAVLSDMKHTSYLKPIRAMVNRYYRVQGISIDELDADGSNLPMILKNMNSKQLRNFETWSKEKFGVVFSVTPEEGHISLIIKNDVNGEIITNVADTGYGYSQMLPIVMLLWMIHSKKNSAFQDKYRTIVIEQPELHLHPAYQAKMIDVFANIIAEAKQNGIILKIILETHSEAMINQIGNLIEGNKLDAEDVNILIFDKVNQQTQITSKHFNEKGLLVGWPIGFFSTDEG